MIFSSDLQKATQRNVLRSLTAIYEPLAVARPLTLVEKLVLRGA